MLMRTFLLLSLNLLIYIKVFSSCFLVFSIVNRLVIRCICVGCLSLFLRFIIFTIVSFSIISLNHSFLNLNMRTSISNVFNYWEFLQKSLVIFWMACFSVFPSTP